ncbi:MAG: hypothetical protein ABEH43_06485 [Flavobacteriales bacterium]
MAQDDEEEDQGGMFSSGSADYSFKSKNGHEVLPQEGDWGLGSSIAAISNSFARSNSDSTAMIGLPTVASHPPAVVFMGRMFIGDGTAFRGGILLNWNQETTHKSVEKSVTTFNPLNPQFVEDQMRVVEKSVMLRAGYEKRRGSQRVQGVYGGEVFLGYFSTKRFYDYGNDMNINFDQPEISDFEGDNEYSDDPVLGRDSRMIEDNLGNRFLFGARGFAGVEYFIAPKWSLHVEFGYTLGFDIVGQREQTRQYFDTQENL